MLLLCVLSAASEWRAAKLTMDRASFNLDGNAAQGWRAEGGFLDEATNGWSDLFDKIRWGATWAKSIVVNVKGSSQDAANLTKGSAQELAKCVAARFGVSTSDLESLFAKGGSATETFSQFSVPLDGTLVTKLRPEKEWLGMGQFQEKKIVRTAKLQLVRVVYKKLADGKHQAEVKAATASAEVVADLEVALSYVPFRPHFGQSRSLTSSEMLKVYDALKDPAFKTLNAMGGK